MVALVVVDWAVHGSDGRCSPDRRVLRLARVLQPTGLVPLSRAAPGLTMEQPVHWASQLALRAPAEEKLVATAFVVSWCRRSESPADFRSASRRQ